MQRNKTSVNPFGLPNIVLPAEVIFNEKLSWREKALFGFLLNLTSNEKGYCWASNRYLAQLIDAKQDTISGMISNLNECKYIDVIHEIVADDDGSTKQVRKISINPKYPQIYKGLLQGAYEKNHTPIGKISNTPRKNIKYPSEKNASNIERVIREGELDNNSQFAENENEENKRKIERVLQLYAKFCPSLPQMIKVTPQRKKAIHARLKEYAIADLKKAFQKAEASQFLSGRSGDWAGCNFDWLLNENNLVKVLEGKYDSSFSAPGETKSKSSPTAQEMIDCAFQQEDLNQAFIHNCYQQALHYFSEDSTTDVASALIDFFYMIQEVQHAHLTSEFRKLMPGAMTIIRDYINWLDAPAQDWITDKSLNLLKKGSTPFIRFRKDWARKVDNLGRDPLTGAFYSHE